jgi:hypothetical protein
MLAKIAAIAGGLLVVAYILKLRRRRHEVPFSKLWQRVLGDRQSSSLWHKLKRLLSLLLALTIAGLLAFASSGPELGKAPQSARTVVIIVDASASMKARDKGPSSPPRLDAAKAKAKEILGRLGGADSAMIMRLDGQPAALSRFETDTARLAKVVDSLVAADTAADLPRALAAAADALRDRPHPLIVLIGDGAYRPEQLAAVRWKAESPGAASTLAAGTGPVDLEGIETTFIPIGEASRNVGIVAFNVRRYFQNKMAYEVLVELENFGDTPEHLRFTLESAGNTLDVKELDLGPGQVMRKIYPDVNGGDDRTLVARISPAPGPDGKVRAADAFPLDDVAYALLPETRHLRVLLVTRDNLFLEGALLLDPNLTVDKIKPEDYPGALAAGIVHQHDIAILDEFTPPALPPTEGLLYFRPEGPGAPFATRGKVKRPFFTDELDTHPVMKWVTLHDVNVGESDILIPGPDDEVLASSIRDPLIVAGRRSGKRIIGVGFGLGDTDLVMRVAFPVFLMNAIDWFAGNDADLASTYRTGRVWHVPVNPDAAAGARIARVRTPDNQQVSAPIDENAVHFFGNRVGVYKIDAGGATTEIAANLADPAESQIAPHRELILGGVKLQAPPEFKASVTRSIWLWLALAVLGLLILEWWTYNRRITV